MSFLILFLKDILRRSTLFGFIGSSTISYSWRMKFNSSVCDRRSTPTTPDVIFSVLFSTFCEKATSMLPPVSPILKARENLESSLLNIPTLDIPLPNVYCRQREELLRLTSTNFLLKMSCISSEISVGMKAKDPSESIGHAMSNWIRKLQASRSVNSVPL